MKKPKRYKPKILESDIKKLTRDYMQLLGWFIFPILQSMGCYPGVTDDIAIKNGRVVFIEVKRPGGKQSQVQKEFQAMIEAKGGEYFLVDCYEDLVKITEGGE